MKANPIHSFDLNRDQMKEVQKMLRQQIQILPLEREPRFVAGVDLAYADPWAFAVIIVMEHSQ